jgi:hypothetical protein
MGDGNGVAHSFSKNDHKARRDRLNWTGRPTDFPAQGGPNRKRKLAGFPRRLRRRIAVLVAAAAELFWARRIILAASPPQVTLASASLAGAFFFCKLERTN